MASIFLRPTSNEKVLILASKEALIVPFDLGNDWTEIRMGFYASTAADITQNNYNVVGETVLGNTPVSNWAIGIKNNNDVLPRDNGSVFWGQTGALANTGSYAADPTLYTAAWKDTTGAQGSVVAQKSDVAGGNTFAGAAYVKLKFVISNRGQATQAVSINHQSSSVSNGSTTPTVDYLRQLLNDAFATTGALTNSPWHDGGVPREIPNAMFIRSPMVLNKLRIHSYVIERFA